MAVHSSCCGDVHAVGAGKLVRDAVLHWHPYKQFKPMVTSMKQLCRDQTIGFLIAFLQELSAFLSTRTTSELIVDRSPQNELLKITFNVR
jgi:hypothetical protein